MIAQNNCGSAEPEMPRFQTGTVETAVGQLLSELLVSRSAPLYRRLRFEKQTASDLAFADGTLGR